MKNFRAFVCFVLAAAAVSTLRAETRCPGNVASLPFHVVNRHQIIVAVFVNSSGPYDFLLDTGAQATMVDRGLAAELHLSTHGDTKIASAGFTSSATFADLDLIAAGSHAVSNQRVLVYNLQDMRAAGLKIQGVLGEDFLEQFDMLIDNAHRLLCLDNSSAMRTNVKGPHIALVTSAELADRTVLAASIIVEARLWEATRPVRLLLDSGSNEAILFNSSEYMAPPRQDYVDGIGMDGRQLFFSTLPPQDVKIGGLELRGVPFVSLAGNQKDSRAKGFDGVLTVGLFRWVFVCPKDHFAVFGL